MKVSNRDEAIYLLSIRTMLVRVKQSLVTIESKRDDPRWSKLETLRSKVARVEETMTGNNSMQLSAELMDLRGEIDALNKTIDPSYTSGLKLRETLADTAGRWNSQQRQDRAAEHAKWQSEASGLWLKHPEWSKSCCAMAVKKHLGLAETADIISRRIKKPRKAG